jgi:hypothetical protein
LDVTPLNRRSRNGHVADPGDRKGMIGAQITAGGQAPAPRPGLAYLQSETAPDGTGP